MTGTSELQLELVSVSANGNTYKSRAATKPYAGRRAGNGQRKLWAEELVWEL